MKIVVDVLNFFGLFLQRQRSRSKHTENRIATASKWACATPRLSQTTNCHLHPPLQSGRNLDPQKPRSQNRNPDLKTKIQISTLAPHPHNVGLNPNPKKVPERGSLSRLTPKTHTLSLFLVSLCLSLRLRGAICVACYRSDRVWRI